MKMYRNNLRTSLDSLRSNRVRTFWTMAGIIIGVTSVILTIGIGQGVKLQVDGQLQKFGKDLIVVQPAELTAGKGNSVLSDLAITGELTSKDIEVVNKAKGVALSAPLTIAGSGVKSDNGTYSEGFVIGTTSDLPSLLNQSVEYGSFLDETTSNGNSAILGKDAADKMFNQNVPLGHTFTFNGREFIVIGIFNDFHSSPLSQQTNFDNAIFISHEAAEDVTKGTAPTYRIFAKGSDSNNVPEVAANIEAAVKKAHGGGNDVAVMHGDKSIDSSNSVLLLLTKLVAGVAAISLLVGGLGIMNVMMVSVTERMHEIGIRKAVGATNSQIMHQFLMESSLLSFVGAVLGVGFSYAIAALLKIYTDIHPSISLITVLVVVLASLMIGMIFGTFPAVKAARKDPIEALRSSGNL